MQTRETHKGYFMPQIQISAKELFAALPDAVQIKAGLSPVHAHPLADRVAEMSFTEMAHFAGELEAMAKGRRPGNDASVVALGLSRVDFRTAMGDGFRQLAAQRFDAFADHLALCAPLIVPNFVPVELPNISADAALKEVGELSSYVASSVVSETGNVKAQLRTYGRVMSISRQAIVNDDIGLLDNIFASFGSSAARIENRDIFNGLEANPNLQDGAPVFHVDLGNIVAEALSAESLAAAVGKLRTQPLRRDEPANNKARFVVVAPELEMLAHRLNQETGNRLEILSSPNINAGRWYVFADPAVSPVVRRLMLKGSDGRPVAVEPHKKADTNFDGTHFKIRADIGITFSSRIGVIKGGAE